MENYVTFREIADKLGFEITTVRRAVKKLKKEMPIEVVRRANPGGVGKPYCVSQDDADKIISFLESKKKPFPQQTQSDVSLQRYGYFYILQIIPEALPNRVKIGYTDSLEARLKEHQTVAPTAHYVGSWECKRAWDQAAMDSITREDCHLVMNEVYEGDVDKFIQRAEAFFSTMPNRSKEVELSPHSPLKNKEEND